MSPAPFLYLPTSSTGIVLTACDDTFISGELSYYYVFLKGKVRRICEADITVEAHAQSPDPRQQMAEYEFHPSIWKSKRDQLLQSYIQLQSATFGMEELVGSRILLLPHQAETIARVLGDRHCRYVLADEVGLGKTIEACVILKGLRRRNPTLKTLILAPHTLINQWYNELNRKFWLTFSLATQQNRFEFDPEGPGIIVSTEDLQLYPRLVDSLLKRHWDLLIADEAHKLHYHPKQYEIAYRLSSSIENCLVLSATPILRHSAEYLSLLRLMNPHHYGAMTPNQFEIMLSAQSDLRRRLAYVGHALNSDEFDPTEFHEEIAPLLDSLSGDKVLPRLLSAVDSKSSDHGLGAAQELHSYLSENYRIENRVIRNRRASLEGQLSLPRRTLEDSFSYSPAIEESETLAELTEYAVASLSHDPKTVEMIRLMYYVAASSPLALQNVLEARSRWIASGEKNSGIQESIANLLSSAPEYPGELDRLEKLHWRLTIWAQATQAAIDTATIGKPPVANTPHRVLQVLRAVYDICLRHEMKTLIFCRWKETQSLLEQILKKHFGSQRLAVFNVSKGYDDLQNEVDRFQSDPECRIMLSDELGGEGRNFQVASAIIHADLPWMPAQVEQRIGRVDRIDRDGVVTSIVPYARGSSEADLFQLWHVAFELFTQSMSGMEIVLEAIQDDILRAFSNNPRDGLRSLLNEMTSSAHALREIVEEERYAEESAAQSYRREEFRRVLDVYQDGEKLKLPLLSWAELAGMPSYPHYDNTSRTNFTVFDPKQFSQNAIKNAKFVNPPNMEEALRRSGRQRVLVIRGTFNREIAVQREDIIFFAPGEPWTNSLIYNALHSDRGQSTAIMRRISGLEEDWEGFDCLYSIRVDPRPIFEAGIDPVHLFRAQGYLSTPCYRVVIGLDSQIIKRSSIIWQHTQDCQPRSGDIHLGKRSGQNAPLKLFMERFPKDRWVEIVSSVLSRAEEHVRAEYEFTSELAEEARSVFERRILGQRAAHHWLHGEPSNAEIDEYERISELLVAGIARPLVQLESICFWWLRASSEDHYASS